MLFSLLKALAGTIIPTAWAQQPFGSFTVTTWGYGDRTWDVILLNVVTMLRATISVASVALFVAGALLFTTSAGAEDRKSRGKNMMIGSLLALATVWGAQAILNTISYFVWG